MIDTILEGHVIDKLRELPDESIDCVITSPPYWGLRDYKIPPVIWDAKDGCDHEWGDTRNIPTGRNDCGRDIGGRGGNYQEDAPEHTLSSTGQFCLKCPAWRGSLGLEPTYQLYISHLTQVFSEVKRVMKRTGTLWVNIGDSYSGSGKGIGTDRTKCKEVYTDDDIVKSDWKQIDIPPKSLIGIPERFAITMTDELGLTRRNTLIWEKPNCMPSSAEDRFTVDFEYIYFYTKSQRYWFERQFEPLTENEVGWRRTGNDTRFLYKCYNDKNNHNGQGASTLGLANPLGRNKRCVWTIPTEPYPEAHFATFPQALVIPMIQAGCPPNGIVLDPFAGSGTTLAVAQRLGRRWIGIEINPEYISMAYKRISEYETPLLNLMEDNYV